MDGRRGQTRGASEGGVEVGVGVKDPSVKVRLKPLDMTNSSLGSRWRVVDFFLNPFNEVEGPESKKSTCYPY